MGNVDRKRPGGLSRSSLRDVLGDLDENDGEEGGQQPNANPSRRRASLLKMQAEEEEEYEAKRLVMEGEKVKNDKGLMLSPMNDVKANKRSVRGDILTGLEGERSPRSPRTLQSNSDMFHVLSDR